MTRPPEVARIPGARPDAEEKVMPDDSTGFPNLLVVIGASAGGLQPIREIISHLPFTFQATVIVATHRDRQSQRNHLAEILRHDARLAVREPVAGDSLNCTTIYVGEPSKVVRVAGREVQLDDLTGELARCRQIDALFLSAARYAGRNAAGVILSGMLWDGVAGLQAIHEAGGKCIVQDPADAAYDELPRRALEEVDVDFIETPIGIAGVLVELAADRSCQ